MVRPYILLRRSFASDMSLQACTIYFTLGMFSINIQYDIHRPFSHALQLRQAKLSFPSVYLLVGVCSDELVRRHKSQSVMNHAERYASLPHCTFTPLKLGIIRCESARHCRWVDEIVQDAPWVIDAEFLDKWEIDYVAHDEDPYAAEGHDDVYGFAKSQGKPPSFSTRYLSFTTKQCH
jgi:choline-phosphate cytidylyltransferase